MSNPARAVTVLGLFRSMTNTLNTVAIVAELCSARGLALVASALLVFLYLTVSLLIYARYASMLSICSHYFIQYKLATADKLS